ncbi:MAG: HAMP domain-containing protein, partial [Gammaproteobacteria bacterium]|nr:HAMP domain-containing protein [Gammaproteobacteria bacterium]
LPAELARKTFFSFLVSMAVIFLIIFLVINVVIRKLVLKPVSQIIRMADETSKGNLRTAEIKVTGNDEIADMLRAFNRMRRSIIKIVQMMKRMQAQAKAAGNPVPGPKPKPIPKS